MYKTKGLSIIVEYAPKKADNDHPVGMVGAGYEVGTFNTRSGEEITQYAVGLNKFIVGHKLKVQTDFTYRDFELSQDRIQI